MTPADTIREALTQHHAVGYEVVWGERCPICEAHEPFAALTELEQQRDEASTKAIQRADALEAAEADRDRLQAELTAARDLAFSLGIELGRYREALEQIASLHIPNAYHPPVWSEIARASLAAPDTPPDA